MSRKRCKVCKSWTTGQCCAEVSVPLETQQEMLNEVIADNDKLLQRLQDEPLQGLKYDNGKPDLTLLPKAAKDAIAKVFMFGASKYGRNQYKKGMKWTRLLAATERHLSAFTDGQDNDVESSLNHLAHAGACIMMLLEYYEKNLGQDDRNQ